MAKMISSFSSSFSEKINAVRNGFRVFKKHRVFLFNILKKTFAVIDFCETGIDSIGELFEFDFSDPTAKWTSEEIAFFVTIVCLLETKDVNKWVSNYKPANHGFYTHPENVDEFMNIYGRYLEQFGFKPKSDNDGGDDGKSTPNTPSPDLLNV
jgi:hypothetical protein